MLVWAGVAAYTVPAPSAVPAVTRGVVDAFGVAGRGVALIPGLVLRFGPLPAAGPLKLSMAAADSLREARAGPLLVTAPAESLPASVDDANVTTTATATTKTDLKRITGVTGPPIPAPDQLLQESNGAAPLAIPLEAANSAAEGAPVAKAVNDNQLRRLLDDLDVNPDELQQVPTDP
jgi:hypothetical protein